MTAAKVISPAVVVALVLMVVLLPSVTAPNTMAVLVLLSVPCKVTVPLTAVAVSPPV